MANDEGPIINSELTDFTYSPLRVKKTILLFRRSAITTNDCGPRVSMKIPCGQLKTREVEEPSKVSELPSGLMRWTKLSPYPSPIQISPL